MQEICTYGSVRGVPGNRHSYRDKGWRGVASAPPRQLSTLLSLYQRKPVPGQLMDSGQSLSLQA